MEIMEIIFYKKKFFKAWHHKKDELYQRCISIVNVRVLP